MSVIGRKPLINIILDGLNKEQLQNLKANLDTNVIVNYVDFVDLYKNGVLGQVYVPTFNAIFIKPYVFKFEPDEQHLRPYSLDNEGNLESIEEECSILELRSELNDRLLEAGAIVPENVKFTINNIKALTDAECNDLKVGDMIAKKTGNQYHVYIVTYKEPGQGMCLTYADASVVETQSYDYTTGHWVYNSEDKTKLGVSNLPDYPASTDIGQLICRKGVLQFYVPVAQDGITSGDTIATTSDLGKALIDHLDVEINGFRARYEYTSGNYVVYSSKTEADSGLKLQVNMISYNTTNGDLSFNQMTFTPDN